MSQAAPDSLTRLDELESLRGMAAVVIVLFHMPHWYPPFHAFPFIRNSGFLVDFFFVLSGYVIARAYGRRVRTPKDAVRFQLLRLGRLYPVHIAFLALFLAVEFARLFMASKGVLSQVAGPFELNSPTALGLQIILGQALGPSQYWGTFNGPAWTISVEFYGYMIFAATVLMCGRRRWAGFAVLFLTGATLMVTGGIGNSNITRFLVGFFAGCLVAEATHKREDSWPVFSVPATLLLLLALVWFKPRAEASILLITAASSLLVASLATARQGWTRRALRHPALVRLGTLSYSIYMVHFFLLYVVSQLVNRFSGAPWAMVDGGMLPQLGFGQNLALMLLVVAATLIASEITYRILENPLRQWARRVVAARLGPISQALPMTKADSAVPAR